MIRKFKNLLPFSVRSYLKAFLDPVYRNQSFYDRELNRLSLLPRYVSGHTELLGKTIFFNDGCSFLADFREIYQNEIYLFKPSEQKRPLIIDCGANIGISTLFFKKHCPESRIIAFEPDPQLFMKLCSNIESFCLDDIELIQKAVASYSGYIDFVVEGAHSGRVPKTGDEKNKISVNCVRLRDYLEEPVEFLKLDIEGQEYEVLKDSANHLNQVRHLFLEYHSHQNEKQVLDEILKIIRDAGFRYCIQEAFVNQHPFIERNTLLGMDLQLNIFSFRI